MPVQGGTHFFYLVTNRSRCADFYFTKEGTQNAGHVFRQRVLSYKVLRAKKLCGRRWPVSKECKLLQLDNKNEKPNICDLLKETDGVDSCCHAHYHKSYGSTRHTDMTRMHRQIVLPWFQTITLHNQYSVFLTRYIAFCAVLADHNSYFQEAVTGRPTRFRGLKLPQVCFRGSEVSLGYFLEGR